VGSQFQHPYLRISLFSCKKAAQRIQTLMANMLPLVLVAWVFISFSEFKITALKTIKMYGQ